MNNKLRNAFGISILAAAAFAQQPNMVPANPTPGCSATPAELEANKKVVAGGPGVDRMSTIDPSYKQHNPVFIKNARAKGISDYEEFKSAFGGGRGGGRGPGRAQTSGPQPPPGNNMEIVTAECDLVTTIHKSYRQDPTAPPGTFYEVFTFDTFRVKNGKLVEHWDSATIDAPVQANTNAPASSAGQGR